MHDMTYDEYIRSILGYPPMNQNINIINRNQFENIYDMEIDDFNLEEYYPEIYNKIYPKVCKRCDNISKNNITKEYINNICEEIYNEIQEQNEIEININLRNDVRSSNVTRTTTRKPETRIRENTNDKRDVRQRDNRLMDLIKVILIGELLRRHRRPQRPQFPINNRPLMPPPLQPGNRPPFRTLFEE